MPSKEAATPEHLLAATRSAFLWTRLLNIPFWSLLSLLTVILYKELQFTAVQIATLIAFKPMSALFAPYWSASLHRRSDRLVSNLVWANVLRYLPFLFFPWLDSPWLIILALGIYMMLQRGAMPAWMEIFKRNVKWGARERLFAFGSSLDYLGPALLPLLVGYFLDDYPISWRWLFFGTAIVGMASTYFLLRIPSHWMEGEPPQEEGSLRHQLLKPWKQSWELLKEGGAFTKFQIGFFAGGAGLMVMHAAIPMFFVDVLNLSYTEMALAMALAKGVGYASTSPLWARLFRTINIFSFSGIVTLIATLFPILLILAEYQIGFLYLAWFIYGFMQAGSELSWHMAGPVFAEEGESSLYSQTSVLLVGVRGCAGPYLGSLLYMASNSTATMIVGGLFCLWAAYSLFRYSRQYNVVPVEVR